MKKIIVATLASALMCGSIGTASAQMTGPASQNSMKSSDPMNAHAMMTKKKKMKKHSMMKSGGMNSGMGSSGMTQGGMNGGMNNGSMSKGSKM